MERKVHILDHEDDKPKVMGKSSWPFARLAKMLLLPCAHSWCRRKCHSSIVLPEYHYHTSKTHVVPHSL